MAVFSYGFYNSIDNDRVYDAVEMSEIFDGIISDGVYATVGKCFIVKECDYQDNSVIIGSGRAWLNHTWNKLDDDYVMEIGPSNSVYDRIDVIVIEVNRDDRINAIKLVTGTAGIDPTKPELINTSQIHQYPICYITRKANLTIIEQQYIENTVGSTQLPWVTGVIDTIDAGELYLQWAGKWDNWIGNNEKEWSEIKEEYDEEWNVWFNSVKDVLGENAAIELLNQINGIKNMNPLVLGENAKVNGDDQSSTALGQSAQATNTNTTAVGQYARATGKNSTALGASINASGENSTAIGQSTQATGKNSIALGASINASGENSIAIGQSAQATNINSIAIGQSAQATNINSIAIGQSAQATYSNSIAIGIRSKSSNSTSIAVGGDTEASDRSTAIGYGSKAWNPLSIALGHNSNTSDEGERSTVIGEAAVAASYSTALGQGVRASGNYSTALGQGAMVAKAANNSIAIGYNTQVYSENVIQLGNSKISQLYCAQNITISSDVRDKKDFSDITKATEFLKKIEAITYVSNLRTDYIEEKDEDLFNEYGICEYNREEHKKGTKKGQRRRSGIKAQNVIEAMKEIYGDDNYANLIYDNFHDFNEKDIPDGIENQLTANYAAFIPFIIKSIQELDERLTKIEDYLGLPLN